MVVTAVAAEAHEGRLAHDQSTLHVVVVHLQYAQIVAGKGVDEGLGGRTVESVMSIES